MVKIVVAPNAYKGCASSVEISNLIEKGVKIQLPHADIIKIPLSDGGDGTLESSIRAMGGTVVNRDVVGPVGKNVRAEYGIVNNDCCIIEMASASGLSLVDKNNLNPLYATTYGTGELILAAANKIGSQIDVLRRGKIIVGLGGSATNDCGIGMAAALGYRFFDSHSIELQPFAINMNKIRSIDISGVDSIVEKIKFTGMCDVNNELFGENGATAIYGRQKGIYDKITYNILESGLENMADLFSREFGLSISDISGAGAAGGLGAGMVVFCHAKLQSGIDTMLNLVDFENKIKDASLVITGEGRIDGQTVNGKVPVGVALLAHKYNIPVLVVAGMTGDGYERLYQYGVSSIVCTKSTDMTCDDSIKRYKELIPQTVCLGILSILGKGNIKI